MALSSNYPALAIIGPTATGKTQLALAMAKHYPIEIISMDSALIYQDMNIGTSKPTLAELDSVPHHLINIINPLQKYDVANFVKDCHALIQRINHKHKIAVIVGGTMMYYHALVNGLNHIPTANEEIRLIIRQKKSNIGLSGLYAELMQIDPSTAARLNQNDAQRIERALEVFYSSGKTLSSFHQAKNENEFNVPTLALLPESRENLHLQIKNRFYDMIDQGFVAEVEELMLKYPSLNADCPAMRCVGYRQVWDYLKGQDDYETMIDKGIIATRQLAKRQLTWLRKLNPTTSILTNKSLEYKLISIRKLLAVKP